MPKRTLDESPKNVPTTKRCTFDESVFEDPGLSRDFALVVFDNHLKELGDVLHHRRRLFEQNMRIKQWRRRYIEKVCQGGLDDIFSFYLDTWLECEKYRVGTMCPKLKDLVQKKRPIYEDHTDHAIEAVVRIDALKWGVKVRTGRFLPDEVLGVIMSFMEEDLGGKPGWFLSRYSP